MRTFLIAAFLCLVIAPTAHAVIESALDPNDPWPMFMQNDRNTGKSPYKSMTVPLLRWEDELPTSGEVFPAGVVEFAPVIVATNDSRVIIVPTDSQLRAYEVNGSGSQQPKLLWSYKSQDSSPFVGKITVADIYTGVGDTRQKTIFAATGNRVHAIPLVPPNEVMQDEDRTRTDISWWYSPENPVFDPLQPIPGSAGGFTPISFPLLTGDYVSLVIGTHAGKVVARDAYSGQLEWEYSMIPSGAIGDFQPQPTVSISQDGTSANVYITGFVDPANQMELMAFRFSDNGLMPTSPMWIADISTPPMNWSSQPLIAGTFASASVAGNYIYVPSDNGVFYVFDSREEPSANGVMEPVHQFVEYFDGSATWNSVWLSTTPGVYSDGDVDVIFVPRETSDGQKMKLVRSGTTTELVDKDGLGWIFGGVAVDQIGSNLFVGQSHSLNFDLIFDLRYSNPLDDTSEVVRSFTLLSTGQVTPIDSDGTVFAVGKKLSDNKLYLFAFQHGILGDMNMNGVVNNLDNALFIAAYNNPDNYNGIADMDQDGDVDDDDVALYLAALPGGSGSLTAIPEPGTLAMAGMSLIGLVLRRQIHR